MKELLIFSIVRVNSPGWHLHDRIGVVKEVNWQWGGTELAYIVIFTEEDGTQWSAGMPATMTIHMPTESKTDIPF